MKGRISSGWCEKDFI